MHTLSKLMHLRPSNIRHLLPQWGSHLELVLGVPKPL